MLEQIVSIENPASLSIKTGRLSITQGENQNYIAALDVAVLIISNLQVNLSASVIAEITKHGGLVVFTNTSFMPQSYCYANSSNNKGAIRPFLQANYISSPESAKAWQQVIQSKIKGQALVLQELKSQNYNYVANAHKNVQLGDITNVEAQVARFYWEDYFSFFDAKINREKQGATHIINICLNYGYTVLRAMVARSLASLGLCLNFGIGHFRKDNPFNLVEDLIEPFRYIVDKVVLEIFRNKNIDSMPELTPEIKKLLIKAIYDSSINLNYKNYRLLQGVHYVNIAYCHYLQDNKTNNLVLPNLLFAGKNKEIDNWVSLQDY